jgi:hypothetical protein
MTTPALLHANPTILEKAISAIIGAAIMYPIRADMDTTHRPENLYKEKTGSTYKRIEKTKSAFEKAMATYKDTITATFTDENLSQEIEKFNSTISPFKAELLSIANKMNEYRQTCKTIVDKIRKEVPPSDKATLKALTELEKFVTTEKPVPSFETVLGGLNNFQIYLASPDFFVSIPLRLALSGINRATEVEIRNPYWDKYHVLKGFVDGLQNAYEKVSALAGTDIIPKTEAAELYELNPNIWVELSPGFCPNNSISNTFENRCLVDEYYNFNEIY